jgi:predicted PurR-regulated permease PerM
MSIYDRRTAHVLVTILLFAATLAFIYLARKPLIIFLFAILFAYLLEPVILRVQPRLKNSRGLAILVVYLIGLGVFAIAGLIAGPRITEEGRMLAHSAPSYYEKIASGNIAKQIGSRRGWSLETQADVQQFLASHRQQFLGYISDVGSRAALLATNAGWLVLIPILAVFFLKEKERIGEAFQDLIGSDRERRLLAGIFEDLDEMLSHFVRAQLYLALISSVIYTVGLLSLRMQYPFVLGALGGLLEFIPVVGPLVAAVLIVAVAFTVNYSHLSLVILFLGAWRVVQDYVISPRILGGRVELHPLATIFGVLVGGEIGGVIGVYLAIPIMASMRILWKRLYRNPITTERAASPRRVA